MWIRNNDTNDSKLKIQTNLIFSSSHLFFLETETKQKRVHPQNFSVKYLITVELHFFQTQCHFSSFNFISWTKHHNTLYGFLLSGLCYVFLFYILYCSVLEPRHYSFLSTGSTCISCHTNFPLYFMKPSSCSLFFPLLLPPFSQLMFDYRFHLCFTVWC